VRNSTVSIIDFGLCKKIKKKPTDQPIEDDSYSGNLPYCSLNTCKGLTKSRRDDMQSIVFILLWMCCKCVLPWDSGSLNGLAKRGSKTRKQMYNDAYDVKKKFLEDQIEHSKSGKGKASTKLPKFMIDLITEFCLKDVGFHDKPDYEKFISILKTLKKKSSDSSMTTTQTTVSTSSRKSSSSKNKKSSKSDNDGSKIKKQLKVDKVRSKPKKTLKKKKE